LALIIALHVQNIIYAIRYKLKKERSL